VTATKSWPSFRREIGAKVEVAAPAETRTPNMHREKIAQKECGWKDGDRGGPAQKGQKPPTAKEKEKTDLTHTGLLMDGRS